MPTHRLASCRRAAWWLVPRGSNLLVVGLGAKRKRPTVGAPAGWLRVEQDHNDAGGIRPHGERSWRSTVSSRCPGHAHAFTNGRDRDRKVALPGDLAHQGAVHRVHTCEVGGKVVTRVARDARLWAGPIWVRTSTDLAGEAQDENGTSESSPSAHSVQVTHQGLHPIHVVERGACPPTSLA